MLARVKVTQLPVNEAARITGLHPDILIQLVKSGALAGNAAGDLSTCDVDQAAIIAGQLGAARAPVEGQPILISDAAKKYGFHVNSFYRWIESGWVTVLQEEPRVRVNEGDIAFARALADLQGHLAGRAVFPARPRSGRPRKS